MILKFTEKQGIFFLYFVIFYAPPPFQRKHTALHLLVSGYMSNGSLSVLISEDYKLVALVLLIKEIDLSY